MFGAYSGDVHGRGERRKQQPNRASTMVCSSAIPSQYCTVRSISIHVVDAENAEGLERWNPTHHDP